MNAALSLSIILNNIPDSDRLALCQDFHVDDKTLYWTLSDPARLEPVIHEMSAAARRALGDFFVSGGNRSSASLMKTRMKGLEALTNFPAMAFTIKGAYPIEIIPIEYYPTLIPAAFSLPPRAFASETLTPRTDEKTAWDVMHSLFELLRLAYHEPVSLTQEGHLFKRNREKIMKALPASSQVIPIEVMHNFSQQAGLTKPLSDGKLHVLPAVRPFFALPAQELLARYLQYVTSPNSLLYMACIALAANLGPEQWLNISEAVKWLSSIGVEGYFNNYSIGQYLGALTHFGLWETNDDGYEGRLAQPFYDLLRHRTFVPMTHGAMIIEPTGDILVPPDIAWSEHWHLASMARLVKYDQMTVYHVDRDAISEALGHDWSVEPYIAHLARMSKTGLPSNMEANIRDWFRQLGRHQIYRGTVIHSDDPVESQQLAQTLQSFVRFRLSERDIMVDGKDLDTIYKKLAAAGQPMVSRVQSFNSNDTNRSGFAPETWDNPANSPAAPARMKPWIKIQGGTIQQ